MKCTHSNKVCSDYNTYICTSCGIEKAAPIQPRMEFGKSMPLVLGYSRGVRFKTILDKLLKPRIYGKTNARVLEELFKQPQGSIQSGEDMLRFLSSLSVANKCYQSCHFYYLLHTKPKTYPLPPHITIINDLESDFLRIKNRFVSARHKSNSFFSYNWLLRKILSNHNLTYYIQFVKPIKCGRRIRKYETMYQQLTNEGNDFVVPDNLKMNQIPPVAPLDDGNQYRLSRSFFSNPLTA